MITAIINAHIFDGENVIEEKNILIDGDRILNVGGVVPDGEKIIDAHGAILMPGLIDSHVHIDINGLRDALLFGITTELEMMGRWSFKERKDIVKRHDV